MRHSTWVSSRREKRFVVNRRLRGVKRTNLGPPLGLRAGGFYRNWPSGSCSFSLQLRLRTSSVPSRRRTA